MKYLFYAFLIILAIIGLIIGSVAFGIFSGVNFLTAAESPGVWLLLIVIICWIIYKTYNDLN